MTKQQLARKGVKALPRKLSIDVGTLGIEPGPAACEAGVIPLHHVILMLLPEAGVKAFTAREGQQLKKTLQTAHGRCEQGASTAEQQLAAWNAAQARKVLLQKARGSSERLSSDIEGENFWGPEKLFSKFLFQPASFFWLRGPEKCLQVAKGTSQQKKLLGSKSCLHFPSPRPKGEKANPQQNKRDSICCFPSPRNEHGEVPKQNFRGSKSCFPNASFFVQAGQRAVRGTLQKVYTSNPTVKQQLSEPEKVVH